MKRYRVNMSPHIYAERLVADAEGAWVRYEDAAALEQRLAALEAGRDGWLIPYETGSGCPVAPDTVVEIFDKKHGYFLPVRTCRADLVRWAERNIGSDVIAYRPVTTPQPAPVQAVPEGFDIWRRSDSEIIVTRKSDASAVCFSEKSGLVVELMAYRFFEALLNSAPSPAASTARAPAKPNAPIATEISAMGAVSADAFEPIIKRMQAFVEQCAALSGLTVDGNDLSAKAKAKANALLAAAPSPSSSGGAQG